jgi:hypothetical protein
MEIIISKRGKRMEKSQLDGLVWGWLDFLPIFNLLRFNLGCAVVRPQLWPDKYHQTCSGVQNIES